MPRAASAEESTHSESVGDLSKHPSIRRKKGKQISDLEEHRRQGRTPYLPTCPACNVLQSTSSFFKSVIRDCGRFFFVPSKSGEQFKYLAIFDLNTGMRGCIPVESDIRRTQLWLESWLAEFCLVGTPNSETYPLEVITDAEQSVGALFRSVQVNRAISISKAAPQGHETVGHAENTVRYLKEALAVLRQDLRLNKCDIASNRQATNAALTYCCMTANVHGSFRGSTHSLRRSFF